ncbi:RsmB/NOP family class I SAM-dependent RNA methyltransferase, partial [Piscicoccus intestinalis]|uniref:RsmB/NOP family class I SAM-dependent RNA methyltransferase n=1 Tax=Piscicoccus intestinalis TaxID=746033 RepID=UPI000837C918
EGGRSRTERREFRAGRERHRSATAPSRRARSADDARLVAYEVMRAIDDGAYANLELPRRLRRARLHGRDAAFVTELVYGATRLRGRYDPIVARGAGRDLADIDPEVLDVLRLGAHQLLGMRVDSYAAVDSSVALARQVLGAGRAGFVNAVLRRVSEKSADEWEAVLLKGLDPASDEALAVLHSHPAWVVRALRSALRAADGRTRWDGEAARDSGARGVEAARDSGATPDSEADSEVRDSEVRSAEVRDSELRSAEAAPGAEARDPEAELVALLEADNAAPAVALVARPGLCDVDELVAAGAARSTLSPLAAVLDAGGDPGRIDAVRSGRAAVQDEGSQLVTLAALDALAPASGPEPPEAAEAPEAPQTLDPQKPQRWLDLCAGPGGKAALLAAASIDADAVLFANDASAHRTRLVDDAVAAAIDAGAEVYVGTGDGRDLGREEPGSFDLVLLDVPCTGLGALRRRPEARWRRTPDDVGALSHLQGELLDSAIAATRPGGLVAYITCSPHPAETRYVVADALRRHPHVRALDARPHVRDAAGHPVSGLGEGPYAQLWPHRHGTDAMFLALLRIG